MEMSHENHSKGGGGGSDESDTQNFQNLVNKFFEKVFPKKPMYYMVPITLNHEMMPM